jgi:hypothetical protein
MPMYACFDGDEDIVVEVGTSDDWRAFREWGTTIQPYAKFSEIDYLSSYGYSESLSLLETQLINAIDLAIDARVRSTIHKLLDAIGERVNEYSRLVLREHPFAQEEALRDEAPMAKSPPSSSS